MGKKSQYGFQSIGVHKPNEFPHQYKCLKFNDDLELEETYFLSEISSGVYVCGCPAGHRTTCRHRQMLGEFKKHNFVDTTWKYRFDQKQWTDSSVGGIWGGEMDV